MRHVDAESFANMSLIIHLNASTVQAPDPDAKFMVTRVEEALRWGADAVSVHINVGSAQEERQIPTTSPGSPRPASSGTFRCWR